MAFSVATARPRPMAPRSSSSPTRSPTRSTPSAQRPPPMARVIPTKNFPILSRPPTNGFVPSRSISAPTARSTSSIGTTKSFRTTKSPARIPTGINLVAASGASVTSTKAARRRRISRASRTARSSPSWVAPTPSSRAWLGSNSSIAGRLRSRLSWPTSPPTVGRPTIAASRRCGRSKVSSRLRLHCYANSRRIPRPRCGTKPRVSWGRIRARRPISSPSLRRSSPIPAPPCGLRWAMPCGAFLKPAPASWRWRRASVAPHLRRAMNGPATNASSSATSRAGRWK